MTRAQRILAVYDAEVYRYIILTNLYLDLIAAGRLSQAAVYAPLIRRRAAAIVATIAECSPEGEK